MNNKEKAPVKTREVIPLIYREMRNSSSGGRFKKTIFHVHTPESHDFKLINSRTLNQIGIEKSKEIKSWRDFSSEELVKIARYFNLFISEEYTLEDLESFTDFEIFENTNEFLAFLILAHSILKESIELVLVCDHNTINGHGKLQKAAYFLRNSRTDYKIKTRIELGIEISCSDKNHVVGILNQSNNKQLNEMKRWMEENIISPEDGTIRMTYDVFEHFKNIGAIGYIAHINSSNIFKSDFLTKTYKTHLFNSNLFSIIGVTNTDQIETIKKKIREITKKQFNFVIDNDAHTVEELTEKFFYLKGTLLDFNAIKAALKDFDLSIAYEPVKKPDNYIKALYVEGRDFLQGKNTEHMIINFSPNFNAIIGGRGTGKSTILNIIGYLTSQVTDSRNELKKILKQGTTCLVYRHSGTDYYIFFFSSFTHNNRKLLSNMYGENDNSYLKQMDIEDQEVSKTLFRKDSIKYRFQVFTFDGKNIQEISQTKPILDKLYTRKFTINELVNIAGNKDFMTKFIQKTIYGYKKIRKNQGIKKFDDGFPGLFKRYDDIPKLLEKRAKNVNSILTEYNNQQKNKLKINFKHKKMNDTPFDWFPLLKVNKFAKKNYFESYAIRYGNLADYLDSLSDKLGDSLLVLKLFWSNDFERIDEVIKVASFFDTLSQDNINLGKNNIKTAEDKINFYSNLKTRLFTNEGLEYIQLYLKNYVKNSDFFELEFNINNREHINNPTVNFKKITELSMGQKVVAILSFVLTYSEFTYDYSPFIVDQPEDNLDNQYIYKNLVSDLKQLKSQRQIILASHNSTIVMNSGSEQVIVMESDNERGWPSISGYMADKKIVKQVINILEGGKAAFTDKTSLYSEVLQKSVGESWDSPSEIIIEKNKLVEELVKDLEEKIENLSIDQLEMLIKKISELDISKN